METSRTGTRRSNQFKGQTVFIESDVKRSVFYRSGELTKYLGRLGGKIEEYLTPSVAYVVTADLSKCRTACPIKSPIQESPAKPRAPIHESRAQKQLRLAREKTNSASKVPAPLKKSCLKEKAQKVYHIDQFSKIVRRSYIAFRRSQETTSSIPTSYPKPVNQVNYKTPTNPSKLFNLRDRNIPESRPLTKPFLRIDDIEGNYKPIFIEKIPIPALKLDAIENDGCPFAGYDKKHKETKFKMKKKLKSGSCEICDEKFDDEDAHVKTSRHLLHLDKKRIQFERLIKNCEIMFPGGLDGFLSRVDEYNASPAASPMPISVLTEPDSEATSPASVEIPKLKNAFTPKIESKEFDETMYSISSTTNIECKIFPNSGPQVSEKEKENINVTDMDENKTVTFLKLSSHEENNAIPLLLEHELDVLALELESKKQHDKKRKSSPAKGTYNPSILEQLVSSSSTKLNESEFILESKLSTQSLESPIITKLKMSRTLHSPKPPPLPLNLDAARSPALKKAMIETPVGKKREVVTLRNLRNDFQQETEIVRPIFTPAVGVISVDPLPPPVLSAVLVSPKEKKTYSTTCSPAEGKQFTSLSNVRKELCLNNIFTAISSIKACNPVTNISMLDGSIQIENEIEKEQKIIHADQCDFKTPVKTLTKELNLSPFSSTKLKSSNTDVIEKSDIKKYDPSKTIFDEPVEQGTGVTSKCDFKTPVKTKTQEKKEQYILNLSPFPPTKWKSSNTDVIEKTDIEKYDPPKQIFDEPIEQQANPATEKEHLFHDFLSIPRKASFDSTNGKEKVQLCNENDEEYEDSPILSPELICDPEYEIITSKSGALRGLDQSLIFRDSPRTHQRKSKLNAFNGLTAHHYDVPAMRSSSSQDNSRSKTSLVQKSRPDKRTILKKEDNVFTLHAFAYQPTDDDENNRNRNSYKSFNSRRQRKTHSAAKSSIASTFEVEELYAAGVCDNIEASADVQHCLDAMSPNSKQLYFQYSYDTGQVLKTHRENVIRTPGSSSIGDHAHDDLTSTPPKRIINKDTDSDDASYYVPLPRQSSRKAKRKEYRRPSKNMPPARSINLRSAPNINIRRNTERSCRTRMDKPKYVKSLYGFDWSSNEDS